MILIKLILTVIIVLLLVSKKLNIGYSLFIGGCLLALLNNKGLLYILGVILKTLTDGITIPLALTIAFIPILGHLMNKYGLMSRMVSSLEQMLMSTKATIMLVPMIIGSLLVSGGALMSCPMVDSLGKSLNISNDKKAAINMIFRHGLYFCFPLTPAMIVASRLGGFNINKFIALLSPIALVIYITGYLLYINSTDTGTTIVKLNISQYLQVVKEFIISSAPITISLLGVLIFKLEFYQSLIIGISSCILINGVRNGGVEFYDENNESLLRSMFKGMKPPLIIAILGMMFYKNIVADLDSINTLLSEMLSKGIPIEMIMIVGSALIAYSLGSINPSVAILYPMILPLAPTEDIRILYGMLIYTSSVFFHFISPLHLCQVVTIEYFNIDMKSLYKSYSWILPLSVIAMISVYGINIIY